MTDFKRELRQKIEASFDEEELKTLCYDLNIRYANLKASGHEGKARELVEYCDRRKRLKELITKCRAERPNVSWPEIPSTIPADPPKPNSTLISTPSKNDPGSKWRKLPTWIWGAMGLVVLIGIIILIFALLPDEQTLLPASTTTQTSQVMEPTQAPSTPTLTAILPTNTPVPEPTNTITSTVLPVPTAIYTDLAKITADNALALNQRYRYGKGSINDDVAFSPDGNLIAIPSLEGVYLYNAETFVEEKFVQGGSDAWAGTVGFSPSGNLLGFAFGDDYELRLWDMTAEKLLPAPAASETGHVHDLEFLSNDLLAINTHNQVLFWQLGTENKLVNSLETAKYQANDMAFSPDGDLMALSSSSDGIIEVWDVSECKTNPTATCERRNDPTDLQHEVHLREVEFSPDGRFLASASYDTNNTGQGSLQIWDVSACKMQQEGQCATSVYDSRDAGPDVIVDFLSLDFSLEGVLASTSNDRELRLWNYDGQNWTHTEYGKIYTGTQEQVLFSPNGQTLLMLTGNDSLQLFHPGKPDEAIQQIMGVYEHWDASGGAVLSQDGTTVVLGSWNNTFQVLSLANEQFTAVSGIPAGTWVRSVSVSPDGAMAVLVIGDNTDAYLLFTDDTNRYCMLGEKLLYSAFSPDGSQIVGGAKDGKWYIWTLDSLSIDCSPESTPLEAFPLSIGDVTSPVRSITFSSPDGAWIATGHEDGSVWVWDAGNGKLLSSNFSRGHSQEVRSVAFSPDGRWLASASSEQYEDAADGKTKTRGEIRLWHFDSETGQLETSDDLVFGQLHTSAVNSALFSPDSALLVSASGDAQIILWEVNTQDQVGRMVNPDGVLYAAFSPDGTFIMSEGFGLVRIWGVTQEESP